MLNILVCEDNIEQRKRIGKHIINAINKLELECEIVMETNNPHEVIKYAQNNSDKLNLYFMDVDLKNDIDGIEAAKEIRMNDVNCNFIFITGHMEKALLTFSYKLKALDYIDKLDFQNLETKIEENISSAYDEAIKRLVINKNNDEILTIKSGVRSYNIPIREIIYFETLNAHKIKVHTISTCLEFYGTLNEIMEKLPNDQFNRCYKAFIINLTHIKEFNFKECYVIMDNEDKCSLSRKYIKEASKNNQRI